MFDGEHELKTFLSTVRFLVQGDFYSFIPGLIIIKKALFIFRKIKLLSSLEDPMKEEPILRVEKLSTKIQIENRLYKIVDNLSFDLYPGKTLALVGESGCGKTMAALSIMRILPNPPVVGSEGKIVYRNQNLLDFSEKNMRSIRGARIAMIFQDPMSALNPVYTIGSQLLEVADLHLHLYGKEAEERALTAMREVGIPFPEERFYDYPHQLSGGMKQRIMIAMALMCEPDILIADEPTTALDVTIQAQILDLIVNLQRKNNMAVLLITHDMGVVAQMAHEVIVMYAAQGVEKGEVHEIFDQMSHPYTLGLFKSRAGTVGKQKLEPIKGFVPSITRFPSGCRFHPRCPYRMGKCVEGPVPDFNVHASDHFVKCWLYDQSIESNEKLKKEFNDSISFRS